MKIRTFVSILLCFAALGVARAGNFGPVPESVYLFSYTTVENEGRDGLFFAWSRDGGQWHPIGPEFAYVRSDYSRWGSEKRIIDPVISEGPDGVWHALWKLNHEPGGPVAYVSTADFVYWGRQAYYTGEADLPASAAGLPAERDNRQEVSVCGVRYTGSIVRAPWQIVDGMLTRYEVASYRHSLWSERAEDDASRFAGLGPVHITVTPDPSRAKEISDLLVGVFFEDLNYAADGGLYAEMVQNRGFEYALSDRSGMDTTWHAKKAWAVEGQLGFRIDTIAPVHPNNRHYAVVESHGGDGKLVNEGFAGFPVREGEKYDFSMFARTADGKGGRMTVHLSGADGRNYGEATMRVSSPGWKKYTAVLTARGTGDADIRLELIPAFTGTVELDMVSLFPQNTFKGRKNGLRADLAQSIADLNPRFVRFPGGCLAHGDGLENMYRWKNTVGPLEARVPQRNIWNYHQSAGLGYYEYFLFCEDIGAEPVPVVPAGVPCQNSGSHGHALGGQQGGIPMDEMEEYVQEVLDLIEWANGPPTSTWGKVRAEAGHPEPFGLKYIGIGNEDLITDVFEERFNMIFHPVREKHPEITVIGTAGPFFEGTDYVEGWKIALEQGVPMLDEHYYQSPGWFIYNQDFYDKYDRNKGKVYLGEYAAHLPGRVSNIEGALSEALYLTALERNGNVVAMSSYAPLLAKEGFMQWQPDLIYFNNTEVKPTVNYYVQQLFGRNAGDIYIPQDLTCSDRRRNVTSRIATSVVRDSRSGDVIVKLVNMLPVEVTSHLALDEFDIDGEAVATVTTLAGSIDSSDSRPVERNYPARELSDIELRPYSLTVLRLPTR